MPLEIPVELLERLAKTLEGNGDAHEVLHTIGVHVGRIAGVAEAFEANSKAFQANSSSHLVLVRAFEQLARSYSQLLARQCRDAGAIPANDLCAALHEIDEDERERILVEGKLAGLSPRLTEALRAFWLAQ